MATSKNKNSFTLVLLVILIVLVGVGVYKLFTLKKDNQVVINPAPVTTFPIATSTKEDNLPKEWQVYSNTGYSYSLKYPPQVTLSKDISVPDETGTKYITHKAGTPIDVQVQDQSGEGKTSSASNIIVSPLYVSVRAEQKPSGYTTLKNYVDEYVTQSIIAGQNSAAGVYASSTPATVNNVKGYLVVISDGSVAQNRDDNYFFEHGNDIYRLDVAYSGFAYESRDKDEVARVTIAKDILSSFKFTK